MSRIERGDANPSLNAIEMLADALGIEVKVLFETAATGASIKKATPISTPFAADGSCFNPSLRRKRSGKFTVGKKGSEVAFDTFEAAVKYLKAMKTASWRRPNKVGNWGIVTAVCWAALPKKY